MNKVIKFITNKKNLLWILIVVGILIRIISFGSVPGGINVDEAYSGYEAYSISNFGVDSWGYSFPVYLKTWGSGMNALQTYLAIPFVKIFGLSIYSIRLPMLIVSCFSLYAFYLVLKRLFNENVGLVGLAFLCVCPWHIMISRWALESNLAPSFLLFGLLFFLKGLDNNKYYMLSGVFYGLSLYAYAITWMVVPLTLIGLVIYAVVNKKVKSILWCVVSCFILIVFACPLIIFLLVNKGFIEEISTNFISIPKLSLMRGNEISLLNLFKVEQWKNLFLIIFVQTDGLLWNSVSGSGVFYYISIPFLCYGLVVVVKNMIYSLKERKLGSDYVVVYLFTVSVFCDGCITLPNINKINNIWFVLIIFIVIGISNFVTNHKKYKFDLIILYSSFFLAFYINYLGSYGAMIKDNFNSDAKDVIEYVSKFDDKKVYVSNINYSQILFYSRISPKDFRESIKYKNSYSAWLPVESFSNYYFDIDYTCLDEDGIYIVLNDSDIHFDENKYSIILFGKYIVAVPK